MTGEPARLDPDSIVKSISIKSLIDGFYNYRQTALDIVRHRRRYAELFIKPHPDYPIASSCAILLYGIAVSFVVYSPLIYKYGLHLSKLYFLAQMTYGISFSLLLCHFSARLFRGAGTLRQSAAVYCIFVGFSSPLLLLADYPFFYYVHVEDFISTPSPEQLLHDIPGWASTWNMVASATLFVAGAVVLFSWMAAVHNIRARRMVAALVVVYLPVGLIHQTYAAPYVSNLIKALAEMIGNVI